MKLSIRSLAVVSLIAGIRLLAGEGGKSHLEADGWKGDSPRDEIRPAFVFKKNGGPDRSGSLIIRADDREGLDGHWTKTFPIKGGSYYRFRALRRVENVLSPRRSALVRILWRDDQGRAVHHDEPGAKSYAPGKPPLAEPEYPSDHATDSKGWTEVGDVYQSPSKAAQAVVELYFRWAPRAQAEWSEVALTETTAPPSRKVRLATVHYVPKGGKTAMDSCRQFAQFIEEAARQKADLVVLPETLTQTGNGLSYVAAAEPIPGPSTEYLANWPASTPFTSSWVSWSARDILSTMRACSSTPMESSSASIARSHCRAPRSKRASRRAPSIRCSTPALARLA